MNIHSIYNFHTAISDNLGNLYPELSIYASLALELAIPFFTSPDGNTDCVKHF
jgi:hypothetical protein